MADEIDLGIDGIGPATLLGRGGSAYVYLAEQEDFGRKVAVKVLFDALEDEATFRRFDRECRAIGAVSDHPNIVVVHGRGLTADDRPYLIMEHRSGGSLAESLAKRGTITEAEIIRIGTKIGNALSVAHRAGVLHRDVKPGNILLSAYNEPALADFGIARVEGAHKTTQRVFSASVVHASREVLDAGEPTPRSDIYALASTLYELAVGTPAFARPDDVSMWAVINRVLSEDLPDPRLFGVSDGLASVIERGMSHRAEDRHESAATFVSELEALRSGRGVAAIDSETTVRSDRITNVAVTAVTGEPVQDTEANDAEANGTEANDAEPEETKAESEVNQQEVDERENAAAIGPQPTSPAPTPTISRAGVLIGVGIMVIGTLTGTFFALQRSARSLATISDEQADDADPDGPPTSTTQGVRSASSPAPPSDADAGGGETSTAPASTTAPKLVFPRAEIGPLDADGRYILSLDTLPESASYRIVVDGRKVTDYQSSIPIFFPEEGRHQLQVQVALDRMVFLTDPVEIYVADAPEAGLRANLSAIRSRPENWPEALRQFDQLVLDGHEDLELSLSDRDDQGRFPYWNYYVDGFGGDKGAAQVYCDSFELGPDECFVAEV